MGLKLVHVPLDQQLGSTTHPHISDTLLLAQHLPKGSKEVTSINMSRGHQQRVNISTCRRQTVSLSLHNTLPFPKHLLTTYLLSFNVEMKHFQELPYPCHALPVGTNQK